MPLSTPATRQLDQEEIRYQLHVHDSPLHSLEQAAAERGLAPDQVVRSLLFRLENGEFVLILMPGARQVSWPKLRRYLKTSRITTATSAEVLQTTGYEPGTVTPFGLPQPLRVLADGGVLAHATLSVGAGARNTGLILSSQDLLTVVQPELVDLAA
jgi:Cys-tRNA(Pro)/Cys-tRNA(Cys) deacylase